MAIVRFQALTELANRQPAAVSSERGKISSFFGAHVFGVEAMKQYLTDDALASVMDSIQNGTRIDRKVGNQVASAMKDWALSKGATHYTHWFQPLTGSTAEKHDSFFAPSSNGGGIEKFSGDMLAQQEPDASSFPSGGIRNTFEARGYTAWDPSSPAFIMGKTLCIPTIFISYTGEALDNKMPLLKAVNAIDKAATAVCQYFDKDVKKVQTTLGWEQEYFLVDTALFNARPDLMIAGRALVGHAPAKGQQLDDHYFGSIPDRIMNFMKDFETEAHLLGIPVTTRHNEVAPNQFEVAPRFEELNLANDHNLLLMDLLEKISRKHHFRVLLHEKPFAGLNGSGKHNNWSLATDTGVNLLAPGKNPKSNLQFLTFFVNTIKAIYDNADLLRAAIASASNDHRLGANEAPPAIISVFIGSKLTEMLDNLEKNIKAGKMTPEDKTAIKLNIGRIPELLLDNTDRNRTSPFAFTGNKFEFRAVGSTANCAVPMTMLNTIVAKQLIEFKKDVDVLIEKGDKKDEAILKQLQKLIVESKDIRFEGNGYGDEWVKEAEKRGLQNLKDTPSALAAFVEKKAVKLFEELEIYSEREIEARYEIELEKYTSKIQIESRVLGDMISVQVLPAAIEYQNKLIENVRGLKEFFGEDHEAYQVQLETLRKISSHILELRNLVSEMINTRKTANALEGAEAMAKAYCNEVKPFFDKIKYHSDKLELLVDNEIWPLPKLREILFTR
jgi:glutamine synthetase